MKPHLHAVETQLLSIGETQGADAFRVATREVLVAACTVLVSTFGLTELARCINELPELLMQHELATLDELRAEAIRTPRQLLN